MTQEPMDYTVDEAVALLDVFDEDDRGQTRRIVHCFTDAPGMMIGADWDLHSVTELLTANGGAMKSGPAASAMSHGIVAHKEGKPYFFATKEIR